jgi:hypothetical protein
MRSTSAQPNGLHPFELGRGPIEIVILSNPSQFISSACRLDTARFEQRVGSTDAIRTLSFDSLDALLHSPGAYPIPGESAID